MGIDHTPLRRTAWSGGQNWGGTFVRRWCQSADEHSRICERKKTCPLFRGSSINLTSEIRTALSTRDRRTLWWRHRIPSDFPRRPSPTPCQLLPRPHPPSPQGQRWTGDGRWRHSGAAEDLPLLLQRATVCNVHIHVSYVQRALIRGCAHNWRTEYHFTVEYILN